MDPLFCLGLNLTWYRTRGSTFSLFLLFGISVSVFSLFLIFGRRLLLPMLHRDNNSSVKIPTEWEFSLYKSHISVNYGLLRDLYAVSDGLKLALHQSQEYQIQNRFYNGWTHDHYVSNLFVFVPAGLIVACYVNSPGCMHDSLVSDMGGEYNNLNSFY